MRLGQYKPHFFVTYTFRYGVTEEKAIAQVKHFLIKASRKMKKHIFWFGWYDTQPNRGLDGRRYIHFHLFLEIEGLQDDIDKTMWELEIGSWDGAVGMDGKRINGNADVRLYENEGGAIGYSISKHAGYLESIACPRVKDRCNKRGRICAYIWKEGLFASRS